MKKNEKPTLSVCITVYNQRELVKQCLDNIIQCDENDIEIIISDDNSSEDIKGLVQSYSDNRIRYYCNNENLGHDRNIIRALELSTGKYALVLRTRDYLISEKIGDLISILKKENASYITAAALNQDGKIKLSYNREYFLRGREDFEANFKLFIHPSGNIYKLDELNIDKLNDFIKRECISKKAFIVHSLIRLQLAAVGDFRLIKEPMWVYTDTESAKDIAVNCSDNGMSVYDPSLIEERYLLEIKWMESILYDDLYFNYLLITKAYLYQATWGFKLVNKDKQSQHHYGYSGKKFSVLKECARFKQLSLLMYNEAFNVSKIKYERDIDKILWENILKNVFRYYVRKIAYHTSLYNRLAIIYKKYFLKV